MPICKIMARRASWSNCKCTNIIIYLLGNFRTSQCWVGIIIVSPFFPLYFSFNLLDIRYNRCIFMARRASWSNCNCTNIIIYLLGYIRTSQCWVGIIVSSFFPLYFPLHLLDSRDNQCIFMARRASWSNSSRKEIGPRRSENLMVYVFGKRPWKEILERNLGKKLDQEGVKI